VYDFAKWSGDPEAKQIVDECMETLEQNLGRYDAGNWSLYELSESGPRMLASPYYHRLHVVQLRVMRRLTGRETFSQYADRWARYAESRVLRGWALARKAWFKVRYY
jgi:hypothetical protein